MSKKGLLIIIIMVRLLFAGCKANVNYEQKFYNYKGKKVRGRDFY